MKIDYILEQQIDDLIDNAQELFEEGKSQEAIKIYNKALNLIQLPKENNEFATWIYIALGNIYFSMSDYKQASNFFYNAYKCPRGISIPILNLRLGQCLLEIGNIAKAKEYLLRAYMLEGNEIFKGETLKYYEVIYDEIKK